MSSLLDRKPGSMPSRLAKLRISRPAPMSSTIEIATWAITSPLRNLVPPASVVRAPDFRSSTRFPREARTAGAAPKSRPVMSVTTSAKPSAEFERSLLRAVERSTDTGRTSRSCSQPASKVPASPAMPASTRLSVSNWRTRRPPPAPNAARNDSSPRRAEPRASSRPATLPHAMRRTSPTALISRRSPLR